MFDRSFLKAAGLWQKCRVENTAQHQTKYTKVVSHVLHRAICLDDVAFLVFPEKSFKLELSLFCAGQSGMPRQLSDKQRNAQL